MNRSIIKVSRRPSSAALSSFLSIVMAVTAAIGPMGASAQSSSGQTWTPVYSDPSHDDGAVYNDAVAACEASWRSFNGDGPYAITHINLGGAFVGCERRTEYFGTYRLSDSYNSWGTGGFAQLNCASGTNPFGDLCKAHIYDPIPQCIVERDPNEKAVDGNPIEIATGVKTETVVDYAMPGPRPFQIVRTYRSDAVSPGKSGLARGWSFDHQSVLFDYAPYPPNKQVALSEGGAPVFYPIGGDKYRPVNFIDADLRRSAEPDAVRWYLTHGDGRIDTYVETPYGLNNLITRLVKTTWPDGYARSYSYNGVSAEISQIRDSLGRRFDFTYQDGLIDQIISSDGVTLDYAYDRLSVGSGVYANEVFGTERLISVTKTMPSGDAFVTQYHYEDPAHRIALTGITDARGVRYSTFAYDEFRRGISSEHDGGADRVTLSFDDASVSTTVTNALGRSTTYQFQRVNDQPRLMSVDGLATANCAASNTLYERDPQGNVTRMTDAEGNVTTQEFNNRNLQTARTLGLGTAEERRIETEWHATFSMPTKVTTPELETQYSYSAAGMLLSMTQTDRTSVTVPYSTNGATRSWTYGYTAVDPTSLIYPEGAIAINNPGFEEGQGGDPWYWYIIEGHPLSWTFTPTYPGGSTDSGAALLAGVWPQAHDYRVRQTVAIPADALSVIDRNDLRFTLQWRQYSYPDPAHQDAGGAALRFLDANGVELSVVSSPVVVNEDLTPQVLVAQAPANATQIAVDLHCDYVVGAHCSTTFDNVSLTYGQADGAPPATLPGLLASVDGPLPGPSDTVSYEYDADANLAAVVNELGHRTEIISVNAVGQPTETRDANGVTTLFTYDAERRIASITTDAGGALSGTTAFEYDAIGQITRIDTPADPYFLFTYDNARRLTAIENRLGERRTFAYDAMGNVTAIEDRDAGGVATAAQSFVYDELGRVLRAIGAASQTSEYGYDRNDNQVSMEDPRGGLYAYGFDALNRLVNETDPDSGVTATALRSDGAAESVTDAESVATTYVRNGWGEIIREVSANRGTTDYIYDERGLMTQKTDARGAVVNYAYDAAGRLLSETFPASPVENVAYVYDQPGAQNHGIGRLANVSAANRSVAFSYDARGNVSEETRLIGVGGGAQTYSVAYAFGADDRLTQLVYPSGRVIDYTLADHGEPSAIRMRETVGAPSQTVMSAITHIPMANTGAAHMDGDYGLWSATGAVLGNGLRVTAAHDLDGRLSQLTVAPNGGGAAVQDLSFAYDPNGNILSINDGVDAGRSQVFQYDALDRLTRAVGLYGTIDYSYDLVGNRTAVTRSGGVGAAELVSAAYNYASGSHRLMSVAPASGPARTMSYAPSGQLTSDVNGPSGASLTHTYDDAGRMVETSDGSGVVATYAYDAFEQRISKTAGGVAVHYIHDQYGRLLAEHDGASGSALREYVWLGRLPVAMVDHASGVPVLYYIHTDQVAQPQKMTDANGAVVWDRVATPFGVEVSVTGSLTQVLRFPGQTNDPETFLNQNWHREYAPELGRYVQSDPIGLLGGVNTYAYVKGNPLSGIDPTGQFLFLVPPAITAGNATINLVGVGVAMYTAHQLQQQLQQPPPDPEQSTDDKSCQDGCPPCKTITGKIVPIGTIAYRPLDTPSRPQHGIDGPHHNLYRANQAPRNSSKPCKCFWQRAGAVSPENLPPNVIPIEPFAN